MGTSAELVLRALGQLIEGDLDSAIATCEEGMATEEDSPCYSILAVIAADAHFRRGSKRAWELLSLVEERNKPGLSPLTKEMKKSLMSVRRMEW